MIDWYEVWERFCIMTENGVSDKEAKMHILVEYGSRWLEWLESRLDKTGAEMKNPRGRKDA